eukprot:Nitzschia sp. Nitz4//scaffold207_size38617//10//3538//NITZ4_007669-RA/size38617-snap-gene-0.0-mRNA-1//1//CDS//3329541587//2753//frame0
MDTPPKEMARAEVAPVRQLSSDSNTKTKFPTAVTQNVRDLLSLQVSCAKAFVLLLLVACAAVASAAAFKRTSKYISDNFDSKFQAYVTSVAEVSQFRMEDDFSSMDNMALALTSYASASEATWPYVTMPAFEVQASTLRGRLNSEWVSLVTLVEEDDRQAWEDYSVEEQKWISESLEYADEEDFGNSIVPYIFRIDKETGESYRDNVEPNGFYAPIWQITPPSDAYDQVNFNSFDTKDFALLFSTMLTTGQSTLAGFKTDSELSSPVSLAATPIYSSYVNGNQTMVALLLSNSRWISRFEGILPEGVSGVVLVVTHSCAAQDDEQHTFVLDGPTVDYLGKGDLHAASWRSSLLTMDTPAFRTMENCSYTLNFYQSSEYDDAFSSKTPTVYTILVILVFIITTMFFLWYDCIVDRKQDKVKSTAAKTSAIVDSFFPKHIRERMLDEEAKGGDKEATAAAISRLMDNDLLATKPIADLFPHATVMFADLVGFTKWSSTRDPPQVFTLLESLYNNFDVIARKRRVFKVETIGDCYVAAAGVPDARDDHAIVMTRFARDCLDKMYDVLERLEIAMGPDTAELAMRFGLHSGPVTGGVLRGEKSRFQLFGDTVNTAAKIESTGKKNMIHLSKETAALLQASDKGSWVKARDDLVVLKGKGEVQTYWLVAGATPSGAVSIESTPPSAAGGASTGEAVRRSSISSVGSGRSSFSGSSAGQGTPKKQGRLIAWSVDVLSRCLKNIVAQRGVGEDIERFGVQRFPGQTILEEVQDVIRLPHEPRNYLKPPNEVDLGREVMSQLEEFVTEISNSYQPHAFHNFQHASHMTQSLTKLLTQVVTPEGIEFNEETQEYVLGITSDPLTQFALTFAALIHDADHPGVTNQQLVLEGSELADKYKNKSCAEQNSFEVAWDCLMENRFAALRACIYSSQEELDKFRRIVVNSVMATDVLDKSLNQARKKRFITAFKNSDSHLQSDNDKKATVVIEYLMQISDVAHTMQHWHVFRKWNERLFEETYHAFLSGRSPEDPSINWYENELTFFDYVIIPMAKMVKDCGIFGSTGDECMNYAKTNRNEWEKKGRMLVEDYKQNVLDTIEMETAMES